ncbi:MAG: hypothetical protein AAFN76_04935 [Pseudomonadota bacterium]
MRHSRTKAKPDMTMTESQQDLARILMNGSLAKELGIGDPELNLALAMANAQLTAGNAKKAFPDYAMLVLCRPLDADLQCGLANCALLLQEYEVALQSASTIIALSPTDCRGYYFSAAACLGLGCTDEAKEDISDALRLAESSPHRNFYDACHDLNTYLEARFT